MRTLKSLKDEFRRNQDVLIDLEEGETFNDWWDAYVDALNEDKKIIHIKGVAFVID